MQDTKFKNISILYLRIQIDDVLIFSDHIKPQHLFKFVVNRFKTFNIRSNRKTPILKLVTRVNYCSMLYDVKQNSIYFDQQTVHSFLAVI